MEALSDYFSHLYKKTAVFITLLLLQFIVILLSIGQNLSDSRTLIATDQLLKLIEEKIPTVHYRSGLKMEFKDCAVCLSNFEDGETIRKLHCKHTFHKICLDMWLQQDSSTCPLCRREVLPEEIAAKYRRRFHNYDGSDEELVFVLSAVLGNNLRRLY